MNNLIRCSWNDCKSTDVTYIGEDYKRRKIYLCKKTSKENYEVNKEVQVFKMKIVTLGSKLEVFMILKLMQ